MPISAPTVGLSFGSFGDIVTVLQLAWELRAALEESGGASAELRALVGDIDAFTRALQDVQANVERRRRTLRPDVVNGIAAALSRCRVVLSAIQQRFARARGQTSGSGWQKYWGTAAWSILGGKKVVEALRARLSEQLGIMQLYLSLSQANSLDSVQDATVAHGTTLQRIYAIVQDIQLRFDVGVPTWPFADLSGPLYYPPVARTSFQRLRDVYEALRGAHPDLDSMLKDNYGITAEDLSRCATLSTPVKLLIKRAGHEDPGCSVIECFFFREAAFGEWQVLVSAGMFEPELRKVLKALLERRHTVGVDCNCALSCNVRYRGFMDEMIWRCTASELYSEVSATIFDCLQPHSIYPGWLRKLEHSFYEWPDPEQLRSVVLPTFRQQQLSADQMVDHIAKVPKNPLDHWVDIAYGHQTILFSVDGAALTELLVGHALPASTRPHHHEVQLPDSGYVYVSGVGHVDMVLERLRFP